MQWAGRRADLETACDKGASVLLQHVEELAVLYASHL